MRGLHGGFTYIEVLLAMGIFLLVISFMVPAWRFSAETRVETAEQLRIIELAKAEMELIKISPTYLHPGETREKNYPPLVADGQEEQKYAVRHEIAELNDPPEGVGGRVVTVAVGPTPFDPHNYLNFELVGWLPVVAAPPPTPPDAISAVALSWMTPGGSINDKEGVYDEGAVLFKAPGGVKLNPQGYPVFTAPAMYFESDLEIKQMSVLTLNAGYVVFREEVTLETHVVHDDGALVLGLYPGSGIDGSLISGGVPGVLYGKVYFSKGLKLGNMEIVPPGAYYCPAGARLAGDEGYLIYFGPA